MNPLFYKADARMLSLIRISIGSWFLIDLLSMLVSGYVKEAYVDAKINLPFYGFEWLEPLPGWGIYLLFFLLVISSVFIIIGYYSHQALIFFIIGFGYIFLLDIAYTLNKFYLFLLLAFYLSILPVDKNLSLQIRKHPESEVKVIPSWMILLFQVQLGLIYLFSGIAKLNSDWLIHAQPLSTFFSGRWPFTYLAEDEVKYAAYAFSYGGVVFDLSIIILLWNRKTRVFGQWWQTAFHLLNFIILHIGSLSIFMCLLTWLLFPTSWIKKKLCYHEIIPEPLLTYTRRQRNRIVIALSFLLFVHILVPLRHHISGNDVNWTEKGHRFSWRLMSRTKNGSSSSFVVSDPASGKQWKIRFREYLTWRQYFKMSAETDLVIYFAHYLKKEWAKKGYPDVQVKARVLTTINSSGPQLLVPEDLDLTTVSRSFLIDRVSNPRKEE